MQYGGAEVFDGGEIVEPVAEGPFEDIQA